MNFGKNTRALFIEELGLNQSFNLMYEANVDFTTVASRRIKEILQNLVEISYWMPMLMNQLDRHNIKYIGDEHR